MYREGKNHLDFPVRPRPKVLIWKSDTWHLQQGTTSLLCSMWRNAGDYSVEKAIENVKNAMDPGSNIRGVHMEAPYVAPGYGNSGGDTCGSDVNVINGKLHGSQLPLSVAIRNMRKHTGTGVHKQIRMVTSNLVKGALRRETSCERISNILFFDKESICP